MRGNYHDVKGVKSYKKQYISKTALIIYKLTHFINYFNLMFIQGRLNATHVSLLNNLLILYLDILRELIQLYKRSLSL